MPEAIQSNTLQKAKTELGVSGTSFFKGFISSEEYVRDLIGNNALRQYDIMRRSDSTIHAALLVCKLPILAASWQIEPASDEDGDIEVADFVTRELFNRNLQFLDVMREMMTYLDFGFCVAEKVYGETDFNGKLRIGIEKIATRKQRSILQWAIGLNDSQPGITQMTLKGPNIEIPRVKLIYLTNEREGENYEGISLLRFAYKPWKIKDTLDIINAIALERMAIGVPKVTKTGETVQPGELEKLHTALRQFRANQESFIDPPAGTDVDMLDMKANTTKDVLPTIQYLDRQIVKSVLAQFLELGSAGGSSGSRALSEDHSRLYMKALAAIADTIRQAFQLDLINQLVDLNYSNLKNGYPKLTVSGISDDNVTALATAVSSLVTAGALTPDPDMENSIRGRLTLPELPEKMYDGYFEDRQPINQPADPPVDNPQDPNNPQPPKDPKKPPVKVPKKTDPKADPKKKASIVADARRAYGRLLDELAEV